MKGETAQKPNTGDADVGATVVKTGMRSARSEHGWDSVQYTMVVPLD